MKFNYQARNSQGQTQVGVVEASTKEAALQILGRSGLYITVLEPTQARPIYERRIAFLDHVSPKEVMLFSRELSIMFESHVPLVESLRTLSAQTKNPTFKEKLLEISENVEGGTPLSQALSNHPSLFSTYYISMTKSGETSGSLSKTLSSLAEHLEREYALSRKIKGALTYPAFVVFLAVAVLFLMMFFVIPNLTKVLEGFNQDLPLSTRIVIGMAEGLRKWWYLVFAFFAGIAVLVYRYLRTASGKKIFNIVILKVPVIGSLLSMVYISRFAENLATLIASGIPITKALEITQDILGNGVYQGIIQEAREAVSSGSTISEVLKKYPLQFPPLFTQMVHVGEKSGTLDTTLGHIVKFYEREVSDAVDSFISLLEPALIVVLGLLVGGMMASVLLPLYQVSFA